jgi:hypothetical protein
MARQQQETRRGVHDRRALVADAAGLTMKRVADREAFADALARALAGHTTIDNAELASVLGRLQHLYRG